MDDPLLNKQTSSDNDEVILEDLSPELQQRFKDIQSHMTESEVKATQEKTKIRASVDESLAKAKQLIKKIDETSDELEKADADAEEELDALTLHQIQEEAQEDEEDEKGEE